MYLRHTGFIITHSCWNISFPNPIPAVRHFWQDTAFCFHVFNSNDFDPVVPSFFYVWTTHPRAHCSLSLLHIVISFKQVASLRSDLFLKRELCKENIQKLRLPHNKTHSPHPQLVIGDSCPSLSLICCVKKGAFHCLQVFAHRGSFWVFSVLLEVFTLQYKEAWDHCCDLTLYKWNWNEGFTAFALFRQFLLVHDLFAPEQLC